MTTFQPAPDGSSLLTDLRRACESTKPDETPVIYTLGQLRVILASLVVDHRSRRPQRATVRLADGTSRTFTAWPVREGWHAAPPCSDSQPVYATPCDAVLAHARTLGLDVADATSPPAAFDKIAPAPAPDDPLSSIKTMQTALLARPLDHDTLALLLVLKVARQEIERLRALLPPFVAAHNLDRAQIALLGASRPGAGLVGLAYAIDTVAPDVDAAPPAAQETKP